MSDNHTLYIECGSSTKKQLNDAIVDAISAFPDIKTKYMINLVMVSNGTVPVGYAYVYFTNSMIYNMLLGNEPDGTPRYDLKLIEKDTPKSGDKVCWEDLDDEPEYIKVPKSPLIKLMPYSISSEQSVIERKLNPLWVPVPFGVYKIFKARPIRVEDGDIPNVLFAPSYKPINAAIIKAYFTPFCDDSTTKVKRVFKKETIEDTYPFVDIISNDKKVHKVFITFDPKTTNGEYALVMTKRSVIGDDIYYFQYAKNRK